MRASRPMTALGLALGLLVFTGCRGEKPAEPAPTAAPKAVAKAEPVAATPAAPTSKAAPAAQAAPKAKPPGPDACFDCHPDHTDGFLSTGMGRSLYRPGAQPTIEDFTPEKATIKQPHTGLVYRAWVDEQGKWWQSESLPGTDYTRTLEVEWVVGSGNATRSYLGRVEGEVIQMPLTWYSKRRIWDMSPGYEVKDHFRFDRPVKPMCLFCHNDLTASRDDRLAGYAEDLAEGITCSRCHGDGTAHVAARSAGKGPPPGQPDDSILNPGRLGQKAQLRICQQCHLTGEARVLMPGQRWDVYDPRTPLEDYMSIYIYARDGGADFGIASHGNRLALSKCFTESDGKLACTRCHDPHKRQDARSHRAACLECHQPEQCGSEHGMKPDAACADCHMRQGGTSDIPHVTFTDHFIRTKPTDEATAPRPDGTELVDALAETRENDDPKDARVRLGIAHAQVWRFQGVGKHRPEAVRMLEKALADDPRRPEAWEELGHLRRSLGDPRGALAAFAEVEKRDPTAVLYRLEQSETFEAVGDMANAERALRAAIAVRPDYRKAWGNLANLLQRAGRHDEAEAAYARADELAPHAAVTASNRGHNEVSRGNLDAAEKWFAEARRRDGADPMAAFSQGTLALRRGDKAGAHARFGEAIALDPNFPLTWWIRGRMRLADSDFANAITDLQRFVDLDPKNPNGHIDLARAFQGMGQKAAAVDALLRARFHLPGHPAIGQAIDAASNDRPF